MSKEKFQTNDKFDVLRFTLKSLIRKFQEKRQIHLYKGLQFDVFINFKQPIANIYKSAFWRDWFLKIPNNLKQLIEKVLNRVKNFIFQYRNFVSRKLESFAESKLLKGLFKSDQFLHKFKMYWEHF